MLSKRGHIGKLSVLFPSARLYTHLPRFFSSTFRPNRALQPGPGGVERPPPWSNRPVRKPYRRDLLKSTRDAVSNEDLIHIVLFNLKTFCQLPKSQIFLDETGLREEDASASLREFNRETLREFASWSKEDSRPASQYLKAFREGYTRGGNEGMQAHLKFLLQAFIANAGLSKSDLLNQGEIADLRYPFEWFPGTRALQRQIHLHVGPTNSGKTYHALQRLGQASSGVYAGPLRLLAHEVYTRLNAMGKPCDLVTGDERLFGDGIRSVMSSCTVEMVPFQADVEVAVIDEIQMIGHPERGWAWTQALMGLRAKEVHLCGEERAVPLIRQLVTAMGDDLQIHRYERLSPLKTMLSSLNGDMKQLRKGDCVVVFSRKGIHDMKKQIEKSTGKHVAVVYGSLPPEVRAQQAKLFNDPDSDYDILVASDAIGMGLNLSIKRIIFESTIKYDGSSMRTLSTSDIKQIGGRAGRYRVDSGNDAGNSTSPTKVGLVTTMEAIDLPLVTRAMTSDPDALVSAGIIPHDGVLIRFATYFPQRTPLSYILLRFQELSRRSSRFHLCDLSASIELADVIERVRGLTIEDRLAFCAAPAPLRDEGISQVLVAYAQCVASQSSGSLLDLPEVNLELLDMEPRHMDLRRLETLHKSLVLYLWLSYRFNGIFTSMAMAAHAKKLVEERIDLALATFQRNSKSREAIKKLKARLIRESLKGGTNQSDTWAKPHRGLGESSNPTPSRKKNFSLTYHQTGMGSPGLFPRGLLSLSP